MTDIKLKFDGRLSDNHVLDFYDAARAMTGFQRSLALTTHLVMNGEIITQAPSLKNAEILVTTPEAGSWELIASIVGAAWVAGTASKDTPLGHLLYSVYDYIIANTLGFHVDYEKSLYEKHKEILTERKITPQKLDSLIEKTESSISDMHRPIVASESANQARLFWLNHSGAQQIGPDMTELSYDYISRTVRRDKVVAHEGLVSSYNVNTFKGRIFLPDEQRPIPFELDDAAKTRTNVGFITSSLRTNASTRGTSDGLIMLHGQRLESSTGRLKALIVQEISESPLSDL
ncbi:MAG: hypothetical protein ABL931_16750 [Usitatibacteraceae bacterium]